MNRADLRYPPTEDEEQIPGTLHQPQMPGFVPPPGTPAQANVAPLAVPLPEQVALPGQEPAQQAQPVQDQPMQPVPLRRAGSGAFGEAARQSRLGKEAGRNIDEAYIGAAERVQKAGDIRAEAQMREAAARQDLMATAQERAAEAQRQKAESEQRKSEYLQYRQNAIDSRKYSDPEAAERFKATLSDPNTDEKTKAMARAGLKSLEDSFDPGAWMGKENWQRVLMGIAQVVSSAMGAYAQAYTGQNPAQQIWNNAIKNGLEQEKRRWAEKEKRSKESASFYAHLVETAEGDIAQADADYESAMRDVIAHKLKGLAAESGSAEHQARVMEQVGQLEVESEAHKQRAADLYEGRAMQARQAGRQMDAAQEAAMMQGATQGKQLAASQAMEVGKLETASKEIDALKKEFEGLTESDVGKFLIRLLPAGDSFDRAKRAYATHTPLITTDEKVFEQKRRLAAQMVGTILEGGKLAESDYPRYLEMMPKATDSKEMAAAKMTMIHDALKRAKAGAVQSLTATGYNAEALR